MNRYPKYIGVVVAYMATIIIVGTLAVVYICDMNPVDSLYFVVQTIWTVGYGDVVPPGNVGMLVSSAVMLFGIIGITSALGVVGAIVLNTHAERHMRVRSEISAATDRKLAELYLWAKRKGIDQDELMAALEEVDKDEQG